MKISDNKYVIENNNSIADGVYEMVLSGDCTSFNSPGQFVNIEIEGLFLRRPISVADYCGDRFTIIYKVVGEGTRAMSKMTAGKVLSILAPLGNGYDVEKISPRTLIVGGGVGIPPMYGLAKALTQNGQHPTIILGFNSAKDIYYIKEFLELGVDVFVTTVDESNYNKGFVTDLISQNKNKEWIVSGVLVENENSLSTSGLIEGKKEIITRKFDYICACGPEPMLKALSQIDCDGQFSFESRMGCGFGACMGCSRKTKDGYKRVCKEGPVLFKNEVIWD